LTEQYPISEYIAEQLGCPSGPNQINCLLQAPAANITAVPVQLGPIADGNMLAGQPREMYKQGQFNRDVPLIIGSNAVEGNLFAFIYTQSLTTTKQVSNLNCDSFMLRSLKEFITIMQSLFSPSMMAQVLEWYSDAISDGWWQGLSAITGDYFISCGARYSTSPLS
jgi:carboxylesterase type B